MQKMNRNDLGQNKEKQGRENKDERWTVIQERVVFEKKIYLRDNKEEKR